MYYNFRGTKKLCKLFLSNKFCMSTPHSKSLKPKPPLKGSFPLDHFSECKAQMLSYLDCLEKNKLSSGNCSLESKAYFKCRMQKYLNLIQNTYNQFFYHKRFDGN